MREASRHRPPSRRPLLVGVILAAGVVALVLYGLSGGAPPVPSTPGAAPVTPAARRPSLRLAGRVETLDGRPIAGATVYALPKQRVGADRDEVPHEVTDEQGRWGFAVSRTVGRWIGAVAAGYRSAWLDGDVVDPGVQLLLALVEAPALRVRLVDAAGAPVADREVQLEAWPPADHLFLPGPKGRRPDQWEVTDETGACTFRAATAGPVLVTVHADGLHAQPPALWLPDTRGDVVIPLRGNGSVGLGLRDAATGEALEGLVTVEFLSAGGGPPRAVSKATTEPGRIEFTRLLPAGRYHLVVRMGGHAAMPLPDVRVPDGGRFEAEVLLARDPDPARLEVVLEGVAAAPAGRGTRRAPLTWLAREEPGWRERGWARGAPASWDAATATLAFDLPPGRHRLLVADVLAGTCAVLDLDLQAGARERRALRLLPGQVGRLPAVREGEVHVLDLSVTCPSWGTLPPFGVTRDGGTRLGASIDLIARRLAGEEVVLGPYPCDAFTLQLERSDGTAGATTFE